MTKGAVNTCSAPSPGVRDTACLIYTAPLEGHRWGNAAKLIVMLPMTSLLSNLLGSYFFLVKL